MEFAEPDYIWRPSGEPIVSNEFQTSTAALTAPDGSELPGVPQEVAQDPRYFTSYGAELYHLARISAPTAWDRTTGSRDVSAGWAHGVWECVGGARASL